MKRLSALLLTLALAACAANPAELPPRAYDFEQAGTLTRNNPGLTPGVWYLLYEETGTPAFTMRLSFEDTVCIDGEKQRFPCDRSIFEKGLQVTVRGMRQDSGVVVSEMELE